MSAPKARGHALEVRGLTVGYGRTPVLHDVGFAATEGDILGIIGPNGSGKSTLFKTVLGLMKPWAGQTLIFGSAHASQRHIVGYMPQIELVNWDFPVNVMDVVLMGRYSGLGLLRRPSGKDREAAAEALDRVGMAGLRDRLIGELSGGQRRRVPATPGSSCWTSPWPASTPRRNTSSSTSSTSFETTARPWS